MSPSVEVTSTGTPISPASDIEEQPPTPPGRARQAAKRAAKGVVASYAEAVMEEPTPTTPVPQVVEGKSKGKPKRSAASEEGNPKKPPAAVGGGEKGKEVAQRPQPQQLDNSRVVKAALESDRRAQSAVTPSTKPA